MDPLTIAFAVSAILSATAAAFSATSAYQNAKVQEKQAKANQKIAEDEAQMERNAEAMNANTMRRQARARIALAQAKYAAEGNVGESADATVQEAYVNLSSDLSALHFNSENKAIQAENEALMYRYNAKTAKMNQTSAVIGGVINTTSSLAKSTIKGHELGIYNLKGGE